MAKVSVTPDYRLRIVFDNPDGSDSLAYDTMSRPEKQEELMAQIAEHIGKRVELVFENNTGRVPADQKYENAIDRFAAESGISIVTEDD